MNDKKGTICYFGTYPKNQAYSRNLIIDKCLKSIGWEVSQCHISNQMTAEKRVNVFRSAASFLALLFSTLRNWLNLISQHRRIKNYDFMIVGYPAHIDVILASILTKIRKRKLVMDAFLGLYNTIVEDRELISKSNPLAKLIWLYEFIALHLADIILVDTKSHKELLVRQYKLKKRCVFAIPVGIDENLWSPCPLPHSNQNFRVAVWSTFIPLHGMETIVEAASLLSQKDASIIIHIIGDGQTADRFAAEIHKRKIYNIIWERGFVEIEKIAELAKKANCCIGIMGSTDKANRVIPYKIYQAMALARPVITADTIETRNLFKKISGGILVPAGDAKSLYTAIRSIAGHEEYCQYLAVNSRLIYESFLSNKVIETKLSIILNDLKRENK